MKGSTLLIGIGKPKSDKDYGDDEGESPSSSSGDDFIEAIKDEDGKAFMSLLKAYVMKCMEDK